MSEQPDSDRVTWVKPSEFARVNAILNEPAEPNERTRAAAEQLRGERNHRTIRARVRPQAAEATAVQLSTEQPAPAHPTGYTIGVYLPPEASEADVDAIMTRVADAVHGYKYEGQWDPFVVGHAGDWLYIDHHPDQLPDYAAHVRERWNDGSPDAQR